MSRFRARRAVAGWVLAALLVAAPTRAAGFSEPALHLQDLWIRAWSWLTDLWTAHPPDVSALATQEKDCTGPPPPYPGDPPPPRPRGAQGDQGPGIDPDG
jgi:alkanesulfonate monooxygenase SsuD/methylene tetrahydromethanopterin reductase-like flavin-dependent oxidoreductase (luciferase family)